MFLNHVFTIAHIIPPIMHMQTLTKPIDVSQDVLINTMARFQVVTVSVLQCAQGSTILGITQLSFVYMSVLLRTLLWEFQTLMAIIPQIRVRLRVL
jgi:hypothetical protein